MRIQGGVNDVAGRLVRFLAANERLLVVAASTMIMSLSHTALRPVLPVFAKAGALQSRPSLTHTRIQCRDPAPGESPGLRQSTGLSDVCDVLPIPRGGLEHVGKVMGLH